MTAATTNCISLFASAISAITGNNRFNSILLLPGKSATISYRKEIPCLEKSAFG